MDNEDKLLMLSSRKWVIY